MGDLHQPLHAATWVRKDKKEWDGLGGVDFSYQAMSSLADQLEIQDQSDSSIMKDYRDHKTVAAWVQESYRLAVDFAYAEDRVQFAHKDDLASVKVLGSSDP